MSFSDLLSGHQLGQFGDDMPVRSGAQWTATLVARTPAADGPPTFTDVEDIKWAQIQVSDELLATGAALVTTNVDTLSETAQLRLDDHTAGSELWLFRDGVHVHAGKLTAGNIPAGSRQLNLVSLGLSSYLAEMVLDEPYSATDVDQATILQELIDLWQATEYGASFGFDTSALAPTGVTRQLNLQPVTLTPLDRVISEMAGRDNGFDLWIRPEDRRVFALSPFRGSDLSGSVIIDARQFTSSEYSWNIGAGQFGSDAACSSSAPTGGILISRTGDPAIRAAYGRSMVVASFSGITQQATLDAHARQLLADSTSPVVTIGGALLPVDLAFGEVGPGDRVTVDYDFGLGLRETVRRVASTTVTVTDAGERIALGFV